ncbi:MAG TPA: head-tail adaptor protein [Sphingomicrobium sp.]|jgi:head-tail adaptor|nr:head-tail adaptor protein [Sphingomicrobium sp.]
MQAGQLNHRIRIVRAGASVDDGLRTKPGPWETVFEEAAALVPLSAGERAAAGGEAAFTTAKFRIRRPQAVTEFGPRERLIHNETTTYNIAAVVPVGRNLVDIVASARADDGAEDPEPDEEDDG